MSLRRLVLLVLTIVNLAALPHTRATAPLPATSEYNPFPDESPWGPDDEAGNSNTQTPKKVLEAVNLIRTGKKFVLGHPYHAEMPLFPGTSWSMETKLPTQIERQTGNFEVIHGDIGQTGTQFDALGHVGIQPHLPGSEDTWNPQLTETLYYNRFTGAELHGDAGYDPTGLQKLGVEKIKPFFTRGILIDVALYENDNRTLEAGEEITLEMITNTLADQGMSWDDITEGDVVLVRTGWEERWDGGSLPYYAGIDPEDPSDKGTPGIGLDVARELAKKKVAAVGADNWGVEVVNPLRDSDTMHLPFPVHNELIVKHGIPLQESMHLAELSQALAEEFSATSGDPGHKKTIYMFAYIYVPVPIQGASGSPGSPLAVR